MNVKLRVGKRRRTQAPSLSYGCAARKGQLCAKRITSHDHLPLRVEDSPNRHLKIKSVVQRDISCPSLVNLHGSAAPVRTYRFIGILGHRLGEIPLRRLKRLHHREGKLVKLVAVESYFGVSGQTKRVLKRVEATCERLLCRDPPVPGPQ